MIDNKKIANLRLALIRANIAKKGTLSEGDLISVEQAAELDGMMREMGVDPPKFLQQFFGDPDIRKLAAANVAPAKNMLLSKKAAKR